jgi:TonB-dependent SusC/RagA subfamily outer membrane receptor
MAATGRMIRGTALLHAGLAVLLGAGCAARGPAETRDPQPEEVDVGYGTQDPRTISGSVATVETGRANGARVARVEELFQGRLPGVQVTRLGNGSFSVRVRGHGTLYGDGEPLYVIDGMPVHSSAPGQALIGINPSDVTRVTVLRDAASAAIYGSQAANGVILISTRRRP